MCQSIGNFLTDSLPEIGGIGGGILGTLIAPAFGTALGAGLGAGLGDVGENLLKGQNPLTGSNLLGEGLSSLAGGVGGAASTLLPSFDFSSILGNVTPDVAQSATIGAGTGGASGVSGSLLAAPATSGLLSDITPEGVTPLSSLTQGGGALPETVAGTPSLATASGLPTSIGPGDGAATSLFGGMGKYLPYTMLAGTALNAGGNLLGANQQNENLQNYLNAATWSPAKIAQMTQGISTDVSNLYNKNTAGQEATVASELSELGKSGGGATQSAFQLEEGSREAQANAIMNALMKGGVYNPTGLNVGAGAYNQVNPYAASMSGASGVLGNTSNALLMAALMGKGGMGLFGGS